MSDEDKTRSLLSNASGFVEHERVEAFILMMRAAQLTEWQISAQHVHGCAAERKLRHVGKLELNLVPIGTRFDIGMCAAQMCGLIVKADSKLRRTIGKTFDQ